MQNLAPGLKSAPHDVQFPPLCFGGSNLGSGVGKVPGSLNEEAEGGAPITEGGPPTGFCAVPRGGAAAEIQPGHQHHLEPRGADAGVIPQHPLHPAGQGIWR